MTLVFIRLQVVIADQGVKSVLSYLFNELLFFMHKLVPSEIISPLPPAPFLSSPSLLWPKYWGGYIFSGSTFHLPAKLLIELHVLILHSYASLWYRSFFSINNKAIHPSHSGIVFRLMVGSRMNIKIIEGAAAASLQTRFTLFCMERSIYICVCLYVF